MPVNLPTIQPLDTPGGELPKNPRLNLQLPSQAGELLKTGASFDSLGATALNVYNKYEESKINQFGNEDEATYTQWYEANLQKLKRITDADPTEAYVEFEKEADKKLKEIVGARGNLSSRVRDSITRKLNRVKGQLNTQTLKQRGAQVETYKTRLFDTTMKTNKRKLSKNAADVRSNQSGVFDDTINDIKTQISMRSLETGGAKELPEDSKTWSHKFTDSKGKTIKVQWNEIAQAKVDDELGKGIYTSIENMVDAGEKTQAKVVFDKYEKFLTPEQKSDYKESIKKSDAKDKAYVKAAEIEGMTKDEQADALRKIKDPEVKSKTIDIVQSNEARLNKMRKFREDRNSEEAHRILDQKEEQGSLNGVADLDTPALTKLMKNMNHKQRKALKERIKQPKLSNQEALVRVQDLFLGNDPTYKSIRDVSPGKFQEYLVGLNKSDRDKMTTRYLNRSKGSASQDALYNKLSTRLKQKMIAQGIVEFNDFGKFDGSNLVKLNKAYADLQDSMEELPENPTVKETSEWLDKYIAEKKKQDLFGGGGFWSAVGSVFGIGDEPEPAEVIRETSVNTQQAKKPNPLKGMNRNQIVRFQFEYKKKFKTGVPKVSDEVFLEWVRGKIKAGER